MYERPDDDDESDVVLPPEHLHSMQGIPTDARSMGLDRNVPEGAWLALATSLNSAKPSHRIVAWLLLAVMVLPLLLTLRMELF